MMVTKKTNQMKMMSRSGVSQTRELMTFLVMHLIRVNDSITTRGMGAHHTREGHRPW